MKWFQHYTDSHTNGKMRQILRKHGLEGYALCWICREMVAREGQKCRVKAEKDWKNTLKEITKLSDERLNELLKYEAEIGAIDRKALEIGDLYIPKLKEYSDDYSKQLRRKNEETSLRIDKIRIDKIILHYIKEKGWDEGIKNNPELQSDIFKRNVKPAKQLIIIAGNDELAMQAISEMARDYNNKGLSWALETVIKHFAELAKFQKPKPEPTPDPTCEICRGKGKILEGTQKGAECICVKIRPTVKG